MGWRIELLKKLVEHDIRFVVIGGRVKDGVALRELEVIRDLKRNADGDQE